MKPISTTVKEYIKEILIYTFNHNLHGYAYRYIDSTEQHDGKSITNYYEIVTNVGTTSFGVVITVDNVRSQGNIIDHPVIRMYFKMDDTDSLEDKPSIIFNIEEDISKAANRININL